MNTTPQILECSPRASHDVDLEKQELNDAPELLSHGDTTAVGDDLDSPGKHISTLCHITSLIALAPSPTIKRNITDYLHKVSLLRGFPSRLGGEQSLYTTKSNVVSSVLTVTRKAIPNSRFSSIAMRTFPCAAALASYLSAYSSMGKMSCET